MNLSGQRTMKWFRHVPNGLSIARIFLAIVFPFVPESTRLTVIIVSVLTEFLDGFTARRFNAITPLGQILDPIADKLFILSTVGVLIFEDSLTPLQFVLVAARDWIVALGTLSVLAEVRKSAVPYLLPKLSGKITTAFQFSLMISLFAKWSIAPPLLFATMVVSCLSAIDYLYDVLHRRFDENARIR